MNRISIAGLLALLVSACTSDRALGTETDSDGGEKGAHDSASMRDSGTCDDDMVWWRGRCVDPLRRYEPEERLDVDNVVAYGEATTMLDLPPPPKSGFRLVVPPRVLTPNAEIQACHAWQFPALHHRNVYAARIYVTNGLHHSNLFGVPLASSGPSPYPKCTAGQADLASQVPNLLSGNILDVLFANSTQIADGEQVVFPKGMAFKLTTDGREAAASIHWLNTTERVLKSEIVYDFFTMPDEEVETEIVPFVFETEDFTVPAGSTSQITSVCNFASTGKIVSMMPHTHKRAVAFHVDLLRADGTSQSILEDGAFDTGSDIEVLDKPISLAGFTGLRHSCEVRNELDRPIVFGFGDDEMCTLFGYLYPPSAQLLGYTARGAGACATLNLGANRRP